MFTPSLTSYWNPGDLLKGHVVVELCWSFLISIKQTGTSLIVLEWLCVTDLSLGERNYWLEKISILDDE